MVESWDKQTAVPKTLDNVIRAGDFVRMRGDLATEYYCRKTGITARVIAEQNGLYTIRTGEDTILGVDPHLLEKVTDLEILKTLYSSTDFI